jgi:hypothetical protein
MLERRKESGKGFNGQFASSLSLPIRGKGRLIFGLRKGG